MQFLAHSARVLAPALLACSAAAQSVWSVPVDGFQMETGSPGTGLMAVTMDTTTGEVTVNGTFQGMIGDLLGVHIHGPALPFEHAPVKLVYEFDGTTSGTVLGTDFHETPAGAQDMLNGLYYFVLHTSAHGGGELRGQIVANPLATPYGSGVNPAGSLVQLGGEPQVGTTLTLGVDNPVGTQVGPGAGFVLVTTAADPAFALTGVGTALPGFGMTGPTGELLISLAPSLPLLTFPTAAWSTSGTPATVDVPIPDNTNLVGVTLYAQGALFAGSQFSFTNALELYLGLPLGS